MNYNSTTIRGLKQLHHPRLLLKSFSFSMLSAEFNVCTILISFATILGKANRLQYLFIAIIETVIFNINEMILTHYLVISDAGGSIIIHLFGCYFGLAVAKALERDETTIEESPKESSTYSSDLIAMLGKGLLMAYLFILSL